MNASAGLVARVIAINDRISEFLFFWGGVIVLVLMFGIVYGAGSRYLFGHANASITLLSGYSLLFLTFMGGPHLARTGGHITVDLLDTLLKGKSETVLFVTVNLLSFATTAVLAWYGFDSAWDAYESHAIMVNILRTPKYWLFTVMAIGFALMAISFLVNAVERLTRGATPADKDTEE